MTTLDLTFGSPITAADTKRRTITGRAVPYGEVGNTSVGPVEFVAGSLTWPDDGVVLVREHDDTSPLGRSTELVDGSTELVSTFRVLATTAGNDALVEAAEGVRAGLSVGVRALEWTYDDDDGHMVVTAGQLRHVGLVTSPAFATAQVSNVAANNHHQEDRDMPPTATATTETGGDTLTAADVTAAINAALDARDEAAANNIDASNPPAPAPRVEVNEPDVTAAEYARAVILAGATEDRASVELLDRVNAALGDSRTTGHTGVVPVPMLTDIINGARRRRPTIDRLNHKRLPEAGMKFEIPRWKTRPVTDVAAGEGVEIASQATEIDEMQVDVVRISGGNKVSVELIERSSPAYLDELLGELTRVFRQRSNGYALAQLKATGKGTSTGPTLGEAFTEAIGDSHTAAEAYVPDVAVGGLTRWKEVRNATDEGGRKLYAAANPVNNQGRMVGNAIEGEVEGLSFALETQAAATDLLVWPSEAVNYYEQPGAPVTVRLMQVATLEWEVAVYGFLAVARKHPTAVRQVNVAASGT